MNELYRQRDHGRGIGTVHLDSSCGSLSLEIGYSFPPGIGETVLLIECFMTCFRK